MSVEDVMSWPITRWERYRQFVEQLLNQQTGGFVDE